MPNGGDDEEERVLPPWGEKKVQAREKKKKKGFSLQSVPVPAGRKKKHPGKKESRGTMTKGFAVGGNFRREKEKGGRWHCEREGKKRAKMLLSSIKRNKQPR